jgi:hypothetical protein
MGCMEHGVHGAWGAWRGGRHGAHNRRQEATPASTVIPWGNRQGYGVGGGVNLTPLLTLIPNLTRPTTLTDRARSTSSSMYPGPGVVVDDRTGSRRGSKVNAGASDARGAGGSESTGQGRGRGRVGLRKHTDGGGSGGGAKGTKKGMGASSATPQQGTALGGTGPAPAGK